MTDLAGNVGTGTASSDTVAIDTLAPTTQVTTVAFSADSGGSPSDLVTNVAAQDISGTLTAALAAGEKVQVSLDNGGTWADAMAP